MLEFFLPLPRCERCELVYYTSKKEDEIETDTVSLYLRTSIMFCHLVSVFFVELFPLNVQTWFSHEGPMLDRFQIFIFSILDGPLWSSRTQLIIQINYRSPEKKSSFSPLFSASHRKKQQHIAGGVVTNLEEVFMPFVMSEVGIYLKCVIAQSG